MCDAAAFCPSGDLPDFKTMIGFFDFLHALMNFCPRPFFSDSMYIAMIEVCLSFWKYSMKSEKSVLVQLPIDTNAESGWFWSRIVDAIAPDCDMNAMSPFCVLPS